MMKKKLVIFDLDGTLLNTISDLGRATNYALTANGYPPHLLESYPMFVGNGVRKLIERALPPDAYNHETVEKLISDFKSYYNSHNTETTEPYSGIPELLKALRDCDVKLAVASNKYQEAVTTIIEHYFPDIDFVAVAGQREGIPVKPDPSIVFGILLEAGIPKDETLYVGDSGVDMQTAARACIDSVGVTWGFRSKDELRKNQATYVVSNPDDIINIVNGEGLAKYI